MRNIELNLSEKFAEVVGGVGHNQIVQDAIGYLSLWAINGERYCKLSLWGLDNGELNAVYKDANGAVTYVIGGVPHFKKENDLVPSGEDNQILESFSFHS